MNNKQYFRLSVGTKSKINKYKINGYNFHQFYCSYLRCCITNHDVARND